jgi:2-polyprenyl-3-methyl-5-hydroxy-6-metoxy-1,4-benzoquinol methylase
VGHPERIDPDATEPGILALHLKRYDFALPLCRGKDVLDAACGAGYGSAHLAQVARSVVGVDASEETIAFARGRYRLPVLEFRVGDVQAFEDGDGAYDVICSFETIEHVDDPERTLAEFARLLRPEGMLILSTPNAPATTTTPANPFHRIEWSLRDFEALLRGFFDLVELYGQRRMQSPAHRLAQRLDVLGLRRRSPFLRRGARLLHTVPTADLSLADIVIDGERLERASEIVAICRLHDR